jgi:hypothetical protein
VSIVTAPPHGTTIYRHHIAHSCVMRWREGELLGGMFQLVGARQSRLPELGVQPSQEGVERAEQV